MRRFAKILSFICLGVVIWSAVRIGGRLPADTGEYVEKKYAGWNGVLRGWVYSDWSCSGSFVSWLNRCAAEFEKLHPGVYLEFENVNRQALDAGDIHPPDMLIFSEGASSAEASPIARGGYIFVENPGAHGTCISPEHSAPLIAMYEPAETVFPDSGIDLGLSAWAAAATIEIAEDAFQRFLNGETGRTIVNQAQLAKLIAQRDSGRGPDWKCVAQGKYNWCDQRLMLGVIQQESERRRLCEDFLRFLLEDDQQAALAGIGAFPATGISACDSFSTYSEMERQILSSQPLFPKSEHSASAAEGLVRKLSAGQISPEEAVRSLMQTNS